MVVALGRVRVHTEMGPGMGLLEPVAGCMDLGMLMRMS